MVGLITACLALVRPVGMPQSEADAWLRVAAQEVADLPLELIDEGCRAARRTCTHHAQIVPTIIRETEERLAIMRKLAGPVERETIALPAADRWRPDAAELEAIKRNVAANLSATR